MGLVQFICLDDEKINIEECLKDKGCRLTKRCMTKASLIQMGKSRAWKGIPSTTQLLNGTYESMLKIVHDYAESPDDMAFKLLGTNVHGGLETEDVEGALIEEEMQMITKDGVSMRPDLLETEDGWSILTDYKVSGSFKVKKALGMYQVLEEGEDIYKQKSSITDPETGEKIVKLKGDKKIIKVWKQDIRKQDCLDWVRQLNNYRLGLQEKGHKVDEMRIQCIVRDGGVKAAVQNGIVDRIVLVPIPELPDDEVRKYFIKKRDDLLLALEQKDWNEKCSNEECWDGNKCKIRDNGRAFCVVSNLCKFTKDEKWIKND